MRAYKFQWPDLAPLPELHQAIFCVAFHHRLSYAVRADSSQDSYLASDVALRRGRAAILPSPLLRGVYNARPLQNIY